MKEGTWNFPTKAGHFDHTIGPYFLAKWNKICQQVTLVYNFANINKNQQNMHKCD